MGISALTCLPAANRARIRSSLRYPRSLDDLRKHRAFPALESSELRRALRDDVDATRAGKNMNRLIVFTSVPLYCILPTHAKRRATRVRCPAPVGVGVFRQRMTPSRSRTTDLVIRNELAELALVSEALERFAKDNGVADKSRVELQVALDEIVSNVIKYAWSDGGAHEVFVRMTARSGAVKIEVVDDGKAFDPLAAAPPKRYAPGTRPPPGGVGIHMIRQLVDGIEYARTDDRNHVTLTKRCAKGAPHEEH